MELHLGLDPMHGDVDMTLSSRTDGLSELLVRSSGGHSKGESLHLQGGRFAPAFCFAAFAYASTADGCLNWVIGHVQRKGPFGVFIAFKVDATPTHLDLTRATMERSHRSVPIHASRA